MSLVTPRITARSAARRSTTSALTRVLTGTALASSLVAGVATTAAHGATSPRPATAAAATTAPPWEPDPNSVGGLMFFDSSGKRVFGGKLTDQPIAAYVEGTATIRAGDTKATLSGFLPQRGVAPGAWSGEALGASTTYPISSAPAPLKAATLPVETGGPTDESIGILEEDFPNSDTSTDGYANRYQLRLQTSGPGLGETIQYDSADIEVNSSAGTWAVVYTKAPATATSLAVSPSGTAHHGAKVTLTATVKPHAATGTVQFRDGTKLLKAVALSAGKATYATTGLAVGAHKLSARFVPSSAKLWAASKSKTITLTVVK
jgi:hypothetical protein